MGLAGLVLGINTSFSHLSPISVFVQPFDDVVKYQSSYG